MPATELADFVVDITHDLRTPLTSIRGFADVLLRGSDRLSEAQRLDYLARIKAAAERLDEMITTLSSTAQASRPGES
jgi:signal transduction histidine kinase